MSFHPATLLLAWGGLVIVLQSLSLAQLAVAAVILTTPALISAGRRTRTLWRRARWLLLSIAVLFALATPGERLPGTVGDLGVTYDGLLAATEHVLRLLLLLATLALLHERLGTNGLVAGLHWLLAPLAGWRTLRERIVVRLLLVLEFVEGDAGGGSWRSWLEDEAPGPERLSLATGEVGLRDWMLFGLLLAIGAGVASMR